jgi:hypothetical protein
LALKVAPAPRRWQHVADPGDLCPGFPAFCKSVENVTQPLGNNPRWTPCRRKPIDGEVIERLLVRRVLDTGNRFDNSMKCRTNSPNYQKIRWTEASICTQQRIQAVTRGHLNLNAQLALQQLLDADEPDQGETPATVVIDEKVKVIARCRGVAHRGPEETE